MADRPYDVSTSGELADRTGDGPNGIRANGEFDAVELFTEAALHEATGLSVQSCGANPFDCRCVHGHLQDILAQVDSGSPEVPRPMRRMISYLSKMRSPRGNRIPLY